MEIPGNEVGPAAEPIAITGVGCRFPGGADDPEGYWDMLRRGSDGIRRVPDGRWTDARYEEHEFPEHLRYGGYLDQIDGFDAAFFGIAPRDAVNIDPQQRLLLEVTWEALWDAGVDPPKISGQPIGVFAGIGNSDYLRMALSRVTEPRAPNGINAIHSVAAGRISFLLNVTGPCIALDTACSASLVATHLACQSLRARECDAALAGGVSLKPLPDEMLTLNRLRALSKSSRCRTFDAKADGFVVGEGCGMVVLKRLKDAVRHGDRIRAVIRGTALNHDGRTAVLTSPSAAAQESLMRQALRNAGVDATEVCFVETHGTATPKGDPIELKALQAVYGAATESGEPCILGAVKSNFGHLEAAAGVAGLIKVVLAMEHGAIPKNLHFTHPNPEHWAEKTRLKVAEQEVPWPRGDRPRLAGVSAFGLGGTNAHVIVEEAPLPAAGAIPLPPYLWQRTRYWLPSVQTVPRTGFAARRDLKTPPATRTTPPFLKSENTSTKAAGLAATEPDPGTPQLSSAQIEQIVRRKAAEVMGLAEQDVPVEDSLVTLGMDSIMAMDLQQQLQVLIGRALPGNLAFTYSSVADIARVVATMLWAERKGDGGLIPVGHAEVEI